MTTQRDQMFEQVPLAASWLDRGEPTDSFGNSFVGLINYNRLANLWDEIGAERRENRIEANAHATLLTGWSWNFSEMMQPIAFAWQILADANYAKREAAARERRILALAACIN